MDYLLLALVAFAVGWKAGCAWMVTLFRQVLQDLGVTHDQLEKLMARGPSFNSEESSVTEEGDYPKVAIKIEQHGPVLYAFRKDNDQFLGQGDSKESLIERLGEKMQNVTLIIDEDDGASLIGGRYQFDCVTKEVKKTDS